MCKWTNTNYDQDQAELFSDAVAQQYNLNVRPGNKISAVSPRASASNATETAQASEYASSKLSHSHISVVKFGQVYGMSGGSPAVNLYEALLARSRECKSGR